MPSDSQQFFRDIISAGAILAGFCGTFLAFRIQREANYYRQPNLNAKNKGDSKDIYIGLTHFTSSFFLIILATLSAFLWGFIIPLIGLAGVNGFLIRPQFAVSGLLSALILLAGYFLDELVHYEIVWKKWRPKNRDWNRPIIFGPLPVAVATFVVTYWLLRRAV